MSLANVEICFKCGRVLLRSEQAYLVKGKIVCAECDKLLRSVQSPLPAPSSPKTCLASESSPSNAAPSKSESSAKTSKLAIWSFVLGILSFFVGFITAIPALVFGIVGLINVNQSKGQLKGAGLAIAGIIMSLFAMVFTVFLYESYLWG
jgi:phage FluMu protein Com